MAYSPTARLFYVPSNEWGMEYRYEAVAYEQGQRYVGMDPTMRPLYADHIGVLRAIDPVAGRIVWEHKERGPLWGGVLATGGGLVFTGTPEGYLKAFDSETGAELWRFQTGSGVIGSPIAWEMDGRQYLAVVSGWGGGVGMGRRGSEPLRQQQRGWHLMGISAALVARARTRLVAKRHESASTASHPFVDLRALVSPLAIARLAMVDGSCREDGRGCRSPAAVSSSVVPALPLWPRALRCRLQGNAGHLIGTARMGSDPKSPMVDRDLRSHDHPNRFILGSAFSRRRRQPIRH